MGITRLNHAVLYVRDADRHARFYGEVLGFVEVARMPLGDGGAHGVFLRAPDSRNDHDLALFGLGDRLAASDAGRRTVGLYHLAWEVPTLRELAEHERRLREVGALSGSSDHGTTKSVYARDPDGLEFEVSWLVPADRLAELSGDEPMVAPLDLDAEIARYGADTRGLVTTAG